MKPLGYNRHEQQVTTVPVTIEWIMSDPGFVLGFAHARAGKPFDPWFGVKPFMGNGNRTIVSRAWGYERGRAFGCLAPRHMPLLLADGRLNPNLVKLCDRAFDLGYIL
jgi:hypothetical protein